MVDIHSHLLFGVDDGAQSIGESLELIEQGIELGYTDIVLTSHWGKYEEYQHKKYEKNFNVLQRAVKKKGWKVELHRGNELYVDENFFKRMETYEYNFIGESGYLLVEFHPMTLGITAQIQMEELIKRGIVPVIAHVERYVNLKKGDYIKLKKLGALFQVNIRSVRREKRLFGELIKNRLIDVLATDCHRLGKRDYDLEKYLIEIEGLVGGDEFKRLTEINPKLILEGKKLKEGTKDGEKKMARNSIFTHMVNSIFSGIGFSRDTK